MMDEGIVSAIGNTPLVRLKRVMRGIDFRLYAKLESLNPGGSTKDRPAFHIIKHALETGDIQEGTVVVESSSGNMGIGLAQACGCYGLRFICVVDAKTTAQNISLLRAYGAEVDIITQPDPATGEYLQARIDRVQHLLRSHEKSFWPNQYTNTRNCTAHHQTMHEIVQALGGDVDYLFCSVSTCGTIRGCAEYVRERDLKVKLIAVDAIGSVIYGGQRAKRLIPGHGAAIKPKLFRPDLATQCVHVSDLQCVVGCRRLVRDESILVGGSSGGVMMAVEQFAGNVPAGATCVAIFPDRGERYLDTIYCDTWVSEHFGDVAHLWEGVGAEKGVILV